MTTKPLSINSGADHIEWRHLIGLFLLIALALFVRMGYMGIVAHPDLTDFFVPRSINLAQNGLLTMYAQNGSFGYPPFSLLLTGLLTSAWITLGGSLTVATGTGFVAVLKLVPVIAEVGIVAFSYAVLPPRTRIRWLVPLLLAVYPGLLATTPFWGQTDSLFTLPLLLACFLLQKGHPHWSWTIFAFALLTKFQAVVAIPLLLVITFRRYGWRITAVSLGLMVGVVGLTLGPFVAANGLANVLEPFTAAVDQFSAYTVNALNLWYLATPSVWTTHPPLLFEYLLDTQVVVAGLTAKQVGLILLAGYVGGLLIVVWRQAHKRHEFLWLTAIYYGFFLLPTQMHERYLYPAAIASFLCVAQDRRMWWVALPTFVAFSYNVIITTQAPFYWLGINPLFLLGDVTVLMTLLYFCVFGALNVILLTKPRQNRFIQWVFPTLITACLLVIAAQRIIPARLPEDVTLLETNIADSFELAAYRLTQAENTWTLDLYWRATSFNNTDYQLFVHVLENGNMLTQDDTRPQGGNYPTWRWYYNDWVVTSHTLRIPANAVPDAISAGLYNPETMIRAVVLQNGQPTTDNAIHLWKRTE